METVYHHCLHATMRLTARLMVIDWGRVRARWTVNCIKRDVLFFLFRGLQTKRLEGSSRQSWRDDDDDFKKSQNKEGLVETVNKVAIASTRVELVPRHSYRFHVKLLTDRWIDSGTLQTGGSFSGASEQEEVGFVCFFYLLLERINIPIVNIILSIHS